MLQESRRALGVFQHHDGITGTAKDHVVIDYAQKLFNSISGLQTLSSELVASVLDGGHGGFAPDVTMADHGAVETRSPILEDKSVTSATSLSWG